MLINGENFLLDFDDSVRRMGFYTTRWVEAINAAEAENVAINLVRNDPKLKGCVLNPREDTPMLYATEIDQVDAPQKPTGLAFYNEDETDDDFE